MMERERERDAKKRLKTLALSFVEKVMGLIFS